MFAGGGEGAPAKRDDSLVRPQLGKSCGVVHGSEKLAKILMATPRLLVRNIGPTSTTDDLRRLFGKYGYVKDIHIPSSLNNRGQRFAFIEFDNAKDSESAFDVLNNTTIDGFVIKCQYVEPRDQHPVKEHREPREHHPIAQVPTIPSPPPIANPYQSHNPYPKAPSGPIPKGAVPQPAPLLAAAPLNPLMEVTRYNTTAGSEFTIDNTGRLTRRSQMEEEQRTGRARSPASQNPLLIQSAIQIASAEIVDEARRGDRSKSGVMAYVRTHPQLVIDYSDI